MLGPKLWYLELGIDPTNNVEVLEIHINLSVGSDFRDVSPVEAVYRGGKQTFEVNVEVKKLITYKKRSNQTKD